MHVKNQNMATNEMMLKIEDQSRCALALRIAADTDRIARHRRELLADRV